jgi:hypothetical protein
MDNELLKIRLVDISETIPKKYWRYIHRETVQNFIIYIDSIKSKTDKAKTYEILSNYMNDVELNFEADINYSEYLFDNYLRYIVPIYKNKLGFSPISSKRLYFIIILFCFIVGILLRNYILFEIIFCSVVILSYLQSIRKYLAHKVYGFCF